MTSENPEHEYLPDPDGLDGPPPGIDIECCPGEWVPYPTPGNPAECPRCHSVFTVRERESTLARLGMRPEDIGPALAAANAQAAHEDATRLWWG